MLGAIKRRNIIFYGNGFMEPWHWLLLGGILLILEIFTTTFASLGFGLAALIVGVLVWMLPIPLFLQVFIWLLLSILFVFIWFRFIKPLSVDRTKAGLGGSVIIGETGLLLAKPLPDQLGTVRFSVPIVGADEWQCRTLDEDLKVGDRVVVTDISGNELMVTRAKTLSELQPKAVTDSNKSTIQS